MNFVTWSIRNPVPVVVLFLALTVAGLLSFPKLGVQDMPDIELPAVIVTVPYPGVPPSQLESEITRKIEDAVSSVVGIDHINSTINEGVSTTSIVFQIERDMSEAVDDVRDAVTRIHSDLPADAREPEAMLCDLELRLKDGRQESVRVEYHRGHWRNPMSDAELNEKFRALARDVLPAGRADALLDTIWKLEELADLNALLALARVN